jgi:hypothetical protein
MAKSIGEKLDAALRTEAVADRAFQRGAAATLRGDSDAASKHFAEAKEGYAKSDRAIDNACKPFANSNKK